MLFRGRALQLDHIIQSTSRLIPIYSNMDDYIPTVCQRLSNSCTPVDVVDACRVCTALSSYYVLRSPSRGAKALAHPCLLGEIYTSRCLPITLKTGPGARTIHNLKFSSAGLPRLEVFLEFPLEMPSMF